MANQYYVINDNPTPEQRLASVQEAIKRKKELKQAQEEAVDDSYISISSELSESSKTYIISQGNGTAKEEVGRVVSPIVSDTFDSSSSCAMSGKAVATAVSGAINEISIDSNGHLIIS